MRASVTVDGKKFDFEVENEISFILNSHEGSKSKPKVIVRSVPKVETMDVGLNGGLPTSKQIEQYVQSLPDGMTHDLADVSRRFLSKTLHAKSGNPYEDRQYSRLYLRHRTALHRIEKRTGRKFNHINTTFTNEKGRSTTIVIFSLNSNPSRVRLQEQHVVEQESLQIPEPRTHQTGEIQR